MAEWYENCWENREWRFNHLYWIERKDLPPCRFRLNWAQKDFLQHLWYRNNILKARQLGFSTLVSLLILDGLLFKNNWKAGINDKTLVDAQEKLAKIRFAYDCLAQPPANGEDWLTDPSDRENIEKFSRSLHANANARFISNRADFAGRNSVRISCNIRGGTLQFLHISEFGAVAAANPGKARGILRGSINAVSADGIVVMESTHEGGPAGENYRLIREAMDNCGKKKLNNLEFRFFFYTWWRHPDYKIESPLPLVLSREQADYFADLEKNHGITLTDAQKRWYCAQWATQGVGVFQEYPSIPEEAWRAKVEGAIYAAILTDLRTEGRLNCSFEADDEHPLYVSWDIGMSDNTSLWLMQPGADGRFYLLDCHSTNNQPLSHYISVVRSWEAVHGQSIFKHFLPHDAAKRDPQLKSYADHLMAQGINPVILPRTNDLWLDIELTRRFLRHCVFHARCAETTKVNGIEAPSGLASLESYRTAPTGANGVVHEMPVHDSFSHAADSFRYMAVANDRGLIGRTGAPAIPHYKKPKIDLRRKPFEGRRGI